MKNLTVLSFGGGQDSTALLYKYLYDPAFKSTYAPGDFLVVIADTQDEHPHTYRHVEECQKLCQDKGLDFKWLRNGEGCAPSWQCGLTQWQKNHNNIVQLGTKSCTDKLKLDPIYNYIEKYIGEKYELASGRKKATKKYLSEGNVLNILIGIGRGEEKRMLTPEKRDALNKDKAFMRGINFVYPLVDLGMNRTDCQNYIALVGHSVPMPSNCVRCPYMSDGELYWLWMNLPAEYQEWVELERAKLEKFADKGPKNKGVFASLRTIPERLEKCIEKFQDWTDDELKSYKMNHGCAR